MSRNYLFHTLVSSACLSLSLPTLATDDTERILALPSTAITGDHDSEHEAITLATPLPTGSRLNLSALETPASTSSLDAEAIDGRNNRSVQDAVSRSPGITSVGTPGNGNTALSARGFSGHSSVMTLFDGSRLYTGAGTQSFPVDPWMVERIDIIRGPASVLYGEGATGAVINVIPKKPFIGEIRNHLRLGYGSYDRQQLGLDSGGSLNERLSYRLTLNREQSNGWIDRGDSENLAVSAALRWDASDDLSFTLAHERGDSEPMNDFGTPLIDGHYRDSLRKKNYNLHDAVQRYHDEWTRLNSDWSINESLTASNQLYYIKSRRHWRNAEDYSWDSSRDQLLRQSYLHIKHDQEQIGDRQSFSLDHTLFGLTSKTVVGAEYNRIRFDVDSNSPYTDNGGDYIDPWQPAPGYFNSQDPTRPQTHSTTQTFALFAENRTQLSERWSLVTGIRRDQNHIDRDNRVDGTRSDRSLDGGNWRTGLVYAVTEQLSLYGQYSTSEDGVGDLISLSPAAQQMDLTESKQTELGLKQQFWNGRGEWTLAAYQIVKKKLPVVTDSHTRLTQQVGQQSSEGLEATLELALAQQWHVSANASLVRAAYDDFDEVVAGNIVSRTGNRPIGVPRRTANLWLSKALRNNLDAGLGLRYVDARYADTANTATVPGYTVIDGNLGWQLLPEVRLGLQLNNLLDRRYAVTAHSAEQWLMGAPRSYFATLDYRF